MQFYKAIKGTEMYDKYGDDLIYSEVVAFRMTKLERRQVEDATTEDLVEAFNESDELNPDVLQALLDIAEIEYDDQEDDLENLLDELSEKIGMKLY